jgi:hypothetical protein
MKGQIFLALTIVCGLAASPAVAQNQPPPQDNSMTQQDASMRHHGMTNERMSDRDMRRHHMSDRRMMHHHMSYMHMMRWCRSMSHHRMMMNPHCRSMMRMHHHRMHHM